MNGYSQERRKYKRYGAKINISFSVAQRVLPDIKFRVVDKQQGAVSSEKHSAVTKDVSASGLGFISTKKLEKGNILHLELYVSGRAEPYYLVGEVRWTQTSMLGQENIFDAGVELSSINGKSVASSIHFDERRQFIWSSVLDAFFGDKTLPM